MGSVSGILVAIDRQPDPFKVGADGERIGQRRDDSHWPATLVTFGDIDVEGASEISADRCPKST